MTVILSWLLPTSEARSTATEAEPGHKRALIVAVAEYAPETGWTQINADNDLPLIRAALDTQDFDAIHELRDEEATRAGILRAFRKLLLDPAGPGDLALFHFSGHGQQLTDDGSDELDGYDEALVPYDAPSSTTGEYRGEKHLRDDTLHHLIQELRRKVGPSGQVIAFLDSCFSGTPRGILRLTRGSSTAELTVRGGPPLGTPANRSPGRETGSGFFEPVAHASTSATSELSPYVIFSAARHDQYAHETISDQGLPVGSLTYAVTRELAGAGRDATYRWLHERVLWLMARRVMNEPQIEGDIDALLFNGQAVEQEPFVALASVADSGSQVTLAAGSLVGLLPGAGVELHTENTRKTADSSRIAAGMVTSSTPVTAVVELDAAADLKVLERARAFITRPVFGGQPLRVQIAVASADLDRRLWSELEARVDGIERVITEPDLLVFSTLRDDTHFVAAETFRERQTLLPAVPASTPRLEHRLTRRLVAYARNRALRGLDLRAPDFPLTLELQPVAVDGCRGQVSLATCTITPLDAADKLNPGNVPTWHIGDYFQIRVDNRSPHPAYINILDLPADGTVHLLWPEPHTGDQTPLPAGVARALPILYQIDEPPGGEVILLIASRRWLDMRPFLTEAPRRGDGDRDPLSLTTLLEQGLLARDAEPTDHLVTTSAVAMTVVR